MNKPKPNKAANSEWRKFELLISRLEKILSPSGFVFKSPNHLLDNDTGELREVDCSIKHIDKDGKNKTVSVECRKRNSIQDVTWIEQLACKKEALGLNGTIAVSSKGFSKSAAIKAKKRGVTLKTFEEISDTDVLKKFREDLEFSHISKTGKMLSIVFKTYDEQPVIETEVLEAIGKEISIGKNETPIFFDIQKQRPITVDGITQQCLNGYDNNSPGVRKFKATLNIPPNTAYLINDPKKAMIEFIEVIIQAEIKSNQIENISLSQYKQGSDVQVEVARTKIESHDNKTYDLEGFAHKVPLFRDFIGKNRTLWASTPVEIRHLIT